MSSNDINLLPEAPNPTYVAIVAGVVRGIVQIAAGLGMGWAAFVTGDHIMMAASALTMLGMLFWSAYQKFQVARRARQIAREAAMRSALATAEAGKPVVVAPPPLAPSPPGTTADDLNRVELERIRAGGRL
jgi:hypothetical protein